MLQTGKAVRVSILFSEGDASHGIPLLSTILDFLYYRGVAETTVFKGVAGFGADRRLHTSSFLEVSSHLPVKIEFTESWEKVEELLGKLQEMVGPGMIEVQETTVIKTFQAPKSAPGHKPTHVKMEGKAKLMRIYVGESDRWREKPLHQALVEAMRAHEIAGVTVYKGILGYGAHRRLHRDKPLGLSHDASIMLSVVDTEEKIQAFLPIMEQMIEEGLVVLSDVDIVKYSYRVPETIFNAAS
jgi:PII-like signaling protein